MDKLQMIKVEISANWFFLKLRRGDTCDLSFDEGEFIEVS